MQKWMRNLVGVTLGCTVAAGGCSRSSSGNGTDPPHPAQSDAEIQSRIDNAAKIPVPAGRDGALADVARDAAYGGQVDLSAAALGKISAEPMRRTVAQACSDVLKQKGDSAGASKVLATSGVR